MSDWETASARMDAAIDEKLGDTISYALDGTTFVDVSGFVIFEPGIVAVDQMDELKSKPRIKIAKSIVAYPARSHRLRAAKLDIAQLWRPAGGEPENQGRYWLFDIQKA